jgi:vacuolar-type H+-ATPase subunit E/Vma4
MAELKQLRETLEAEGATEAARLLAEAEQKAAAIRAEARAAADRQKQSHLAAGRREADVVRRQAEAEERLLHRQALLAAKAGMLVKVAAAAKEAVVNLPAERYEAFLQDLIAAAGAAGEVQVILNARDRDRLGEALVREAEKRLNAAGNGVRLTLAPAGAEMAGGLKLKGTDFEVDCSLERLVALAADELEPDVARTLFA